MNFLLIPKCMIIGLVTLFIARLDIIFWGARFDLTYFKELTVFENQMIEKDIGLHMITFYRYSVIEVDIIRFS